MPHTPADRPLAHLLYLHGFRSSPQSLKARLTLDWFARHHPQVRVECPQLPVSPRAAAELMRNIVNGWPRAGMAVIGSSLGGYYANWVARQYRCPAVLLNPAVHPARDLAKYIGENTDWHNPQEKLFFKPEYIGELRELATDPQDPPAAPQLALIARGDEVLDWCEMAAGHPHARQIVLEDGDHALGGIYERYLPEIADFLCMLGHRGSADLPLGGGL